MRFSLSARQNHLLWKRITFMSENKTPNLWHGILREEIKWSPTIVAEREAALRVVKGYFAEIADEINLSLGVEFSTLAQAVRA